MKRTLLASLVIAALLLVSTFAPVTPARSAPDAQVQPTGEEWVRQTLGAMSLEEKIGQILVPACPSPKSVRLIL